MLLRSAIFLLVLLPVLSCGSGGTLPGRGSPSSAVFTYVLQQGNALAATPTYSYLLRFDASAGQGATPASMLKLPALFVASCVSLDGAGEIYVEGIQYRENTRIQVQEVLVYAADASGDANPLRVLQLGSTGLIPSMAVDAEGQIYLGNDSGAIFIFAPGSQGIATPTRVIQGASTQLFYVIALAVDGAGGIYATTTSNGSLPGLIVVFSGAANGNQAPQRVISDPLNVFTGVAVDGSSNIYAARWSPTGADPAIVEFAADGGSSPIRMITGVSTGLGVPGKLALDQAGNLYVTSASAVNTSPTYFLLEFDKAASGNAAPKREISSPAWTQASSDVTVGAP